nr:uncharacterized protein LOC109149237 [Ipomoea trifida]
MLLLQSHLIILNSQHCFFRRLSSTCKYSGEHLSLYLELVDEKITTPKLLVHFMLCVKNQKSGKHREKQCCICIAPGSSKRVGWKAFIPLIDIQDSSKGFIVDNCIIIEACIKNVAIIK